MIKPKTAAWFRRMDIWEYNSFYGAESLMRNRMINLSQNKLATEQTKNIANEIISLCEKLRISLAKRADK